jgi:hypothetical protein
MGGRRNRDQPSGKRKPASSGAELPQANGPAKRIIPISNWYGALIGVATILYFIYQTFTDGFNYISLFLTFAGLSLAAWLAVAWLAIQFVRLNWLIIIYLPAATAVTLGFAAMSQPESLVFVNAPISSAHGGCTGSPVGWIFHGFQPSQCAGIAFGRLGLVLAGGIATLIMVAINQSMKWRVTYLMDTGGKRRFMRNEGKAWAFVRRDQTKTQLDELKRRTATLKNDLKAYPPNSEEAARLRGELIQLRAEYRNRFRGLLHDIHIYRKERRHERRQRRAQWQFKYWLRQHSEYAADPNSITSDSSVSAKGRGAASKAGRPTNKPSSGPSSSKELSRPKIFNGPVRQRSRFKPYCAFRYCVKHWTKHYDIYVYIHPAAPKRIMKTAGRSSLETVLKRGEAPNRIFIDSSGKTITDLFTSDFDPRR